MRIIQASVAKRLAFAKWARLQGLNRHSSATWKVPGDVEVPEALLVGAQIDGKAYQEPKDEPKKTRTRKRAKPFGPVEEPAPPITFTEEGPKLEQDAAPEPQTETQEE